MKRLMLILLTLAFACSSESAPKRKLSQIDVAFPSEIAGLKVAKEDIAAGIAQVRPSYVEGAALYTLRSADNLVRATVQVNRFADDPRYELGEFRRTIVGQFGEGTPFRTRFGKITVWRTTGSRLTFAVWFKGKTMFLLSIRDNFERPRSLMRTLVESDVA